MILQSHMRKNHKCMWELVVTVSGTLWFLQPDCAQSLLSSSVSSRAFVMHSPLELIIMPLLGGDFSHLYPLLTATSGVQYHRGLRFQGMASLPHSMGRDKGWVTWELLRGLGYSSSSSPPDGSLSSINLLYMEDFLRSARSRLGLSSD